MRVKRRLKGRVECGTSGNERILFMACVGYANIGESVGFIVWPNNMVATC